MNHKDLRQSIFVSRALVLVFALAVAVLDLAAARLAIFYPRDLLYILAALRSGTVSDVSMLNFVFLFCLYAGSILAFVLLVHMNNLLKSLGDGLVFTEANVSRLMAVSRCCGVCAILCLGGGFLLPFMFAVTAAAGFMSLIVRLVRDIFLRAMAMKEELDFTV